MSNGKCIVDREKIKDIIQDMRLNMPSEIRQAKAIVADRNDILANARKEAQDITDKAQEKAEKMACEEEIVKIANQKAAALIHNTTLKTKEIRQNNQRLFGADT